MIKKTSYISNIKPYKLASHKIWEQDAPGEYLKLDWNEATIEPSPRVLEEVNKFLERKRLNLYPDVHNKIFLDLLANYNSVKYEYIQYFSSSDSAHEYIAKAFVGLGDSVVLVTPTYDNFRVACESCGGTIINYELSDIFTYNVEELSELINRTNPRLIYICNPNNPTGTVFSGEDIEELVARHPEIIFLLDEAYFEFAKVTSAPLIATNKNIIVTRTFSKAFALANFRIGYILSCPDLLHEINRIRNPKNISSLSQVAAIAALEDLNYMYKYVEEVLAAKKIFRDYATNLFGERAVPISSGGNFQLIHFDDELSKNYFSGGLARRSIYVRDLSHISSLQTSVRVTIGTKSQMEYVTSVLHEMYA